MDIHDPRSVVDFQKFTFSGHLRSHVYKVLDETIKLGHADYACYWALELLCSGLVHSLWNTLFHSAAIHLNRAAPNAFLYLVQKYEEFAPHEGRYSVMNMTDIRNNADVRYLMCEVAATLALTRKSKIPAFPKIKPEHDFADVVVHENLKAPSATYARPIMKEEDALSLFVSINELAYCLRPETKDTTRALYWVAWILKYVAYHKKYNKVEFTFSFRPNTYVEDKHLRLPIWLIWEVIWNATRTSPQQTTLTPYIDALYKMYCLRWTPGDMKKRLPFLLNAILFINESHTLDIHYAVPHDPTTVSNVTSNIPQWISAIIQTQKTFS